MRKSPPPFTKEHRDKLSRSGKKSYAAGRVPVWLGKKHSESTKQKMSYSHAGLHIDEKNNSWKGDDVGYMALHSWVNRKLGKASLCVIEDNTCKGKFEWSNISHEYKRDLTDWRSLCSSHHYRYDRKGEAI